MISIFFFSTDFSPSNQVDPLNWDFPYNRSCIFGVFPFQTCEIPSALLQQAKQGSLWGIVGQIKISKLDHLSSGFTSTFTSQLADTGLKPQTLHNSSRNWSPITQPRSLLHRRSLSFLLFSLFACNLACTHTHISVLDGQRKIL